MDLAEVASKHSELDEIEETTFREYGDAVQAARRWVEAARDRHRLFPDNIRAENGNFAHHAYVKGMLEQIDAMLHTCQMLTIRTPFTYPHEGPV
jgi:hypothetical protein